ncbi:MAG: hypothetical protein QOK42_876 [Frankiaceae bacterium]|jgi:RNA polymerase sigma-70 factor (ECF subfamily)|nr:hypothetical protein [Frankiaceae bacterium]MDX6226170.1 hypothetical protein [Frankiales bacterium]MDX6273648.1 hypothetical protein [Frankiales bacterium]
MAVAMSDADRVGGQRGFRTLYDAALPEVFGYLLHRCGDRTVAEDLCQEVFLAAAKSWQQGGGDLGIAWLVGVARHKLVDHYRRQDRERRLLALVSEQTRVEYVDDDEPLHRARALAALALLPGPQRLALVLRYFDGLAVPEIAQHLERSVHATESVLARARDGFRRHYLEATDA